MKLIDGNGDILNLEDLEPWIHYLEDNDQKFPITKIEYRYNGILIEWEYEARRMY